MASQSKLGPVRKCLACGECKPHNARGLCNKCYKRHASRVTIEQFPPVRSVVSAKARYDGWVASELSCREYAKLIGIWDTSLARSLRAERERRRRHGLPWLDGYRRVQF